VPFVHIDEKSVFLLIDGKKYRPGARGGYSHGRDMSSGGLVRRQYVMAHLVPQTPLVKIKHGTGHIYWHVDD